MNREPVIKSLNVILKKGYLPSRGREFYGPYTCRMNCLGHSVFNLTNFLIDVFDQETLKNGLSEYDYFFTNVFGGFNENNLEIERKRMFNFIEKTGLKVEIEKVGQILKPNQYKIAFYATDNFNKKRNGGGGDFHFILQEKDGFWSSKAGNGEVEFLPKLEKTLPHNAETRYQLEDVLVVTNPYADCNSLKNVETGSQPNNAKDLELII